MNNTLALSDKIQYTNSSVGNFFEKVLDLGQGNVYKQETPFFQYNAALTTENNSSLCNKILKVVAFVLLFPLTILALIVRQTIRSSHNIRVIGKRVENNRNHFSQTFIKMPEVKTKKIIQSAVTHRNQTKEKVESFTLQALKEQIQAIENPSAVIVNTKSRPNGQEQQQQNLHLAATMCNQAASQIAPCIGKGTGPGLVLGAKDFTCIQRGYPTDLRDKECNYNKGKYFVAGGPMDFQLDYSTFPEENLVKTDRKDNKIFDVVVSANSEEELKHHKTPEMMLKKDGTHLHAEVTSTDRFDPEVYVHAIKEAAKAYEQGKSIYIHCAQGQDRSTTFLVGMLKYLTKADTSKIIAYININRWQINTFDDREKDNTDCFITNNFKKCMKLVEKQIESETSTNS